MYAETLLQVNLTGDSAGFYIQAKGEYLNRGHSDHMVLQIVRWGDELCEWWPKPAQGGPSDLSPLN